MKSIILGIVPALSLTLAVSQPALAFGGCVNSPELPTLILALLGGTAAAAIHLRARRRKKNSDH